MTDASENKQHIVFAVLLGIAGLLIILIFVTIRSQGADQSASTSANITNAAPSIDSIYITADQNGTEGDASITLTENTTKAVYVHGTFTDNNGCDEVDFGGVGTFGSITSSLYRSGVAEGPECSADDLDCRPDLECMVYGCDAGGADVSANFSCTTTLQYFADATDAGQYAAETWIATASATDRLGAEGALTVVGGTEVNSLNAIALGEDAGGASIPYGELALGASSAADVLTIWRNTGNTTFQPKVSTAAAMGCTVGEVPIANQHYATSTGVVYASQTALSNSATTVVNASNCYAKATGTGASSSTGNIFWKVQLPADGVSGSCTGTNVINADAC